MSPASVAESFQDIVAGFSLGKGLYELEAGRDALQSLSQRALVLADDERIKATLAEANAVIEDIKEQAGVAGGTGNLTFYGKFANDELTAARWFRIASIALISAAVGIAKCYAVWEFNHPATNPGWTAVVYRTAILVGIGAHSRPISRVRRDSTGGSATGRTHSRSSFSPSGTSSLR